MIAYVENSMKFTKKLLKLINYFSEVRRHKVNIKISIVLLYNSNEQLETKLKNSNIYKIMEYLELNFAKDM